MSSGVEHTDVGAYALGLLEEDDRRAFEAHLSTCESCAAELAELSGVANALTGMGPVREEDPPPEEDVIDLLRRRRTEARRSRRGTMVIAAAAAVTLLACGITIGSRLGDTAAPTAIGSEHAGHLGPAEQFYAEGTPVEGKGVDGVTGGLVLESKGWGTHAALRLAGVKGPLECELVAVSKSGQRKIMTGWSVPPSGYGVPGSPDPLFMHGGSPWPLQQIDHFEVNTTAGKTLLTVKA